MSRRSDKGHKHQPDSLVMKLRLVCPAGHRLGQVYADSAQAKLFTEYDGLVGSDRQLGNSSTPRCWLERGKRGDRILWRCGSCRRAGAFRSDQGGVVQWERVLAVAAAMQEHGNYVWRVRLSVPDLDAALRHLIPDDEASEQTHRRIDRETRWRGNSLTITAHGYTSVQPQQG